MFIGHMAVGFASKRAAPRTSLGTLMIAPLFVDLLWPIFLLAGLEDVRIQPGNTAFTPLDFVRFPWTHSLLMGVVWALLFALLYRARTGYGRGAIVLAIGVVSHWVLDWITHRPDLQLVPWDPHRVGLGLWNSRMGTMGLELSMFVIGLGLYLLTTRARNVRGHVALWLYVVTMIGLYFADAGGPPPPSVRALEWVALATWAFIPWVYWIDRNREIRGRPSAA
jgi:membrane-bound metal-dependent hydrolase YbcI (DUF457 family)